MRRLSILCICLWFFVVPVFAQDSSQFEISGDTLKPASQTALSKEFRETFGVLLRNTISVDRSE
jgi:hypothetical protein